MDLERRAGVGLHEHHVLVYAKPPDLLKPLGAFIESGVRENRIVVFLHGLESQEAAVRFAEQAYLPVRDLLNRQVFLVQLYSDAFERGGRIDHEHVAGVVRDLEARAKREGRSGIGLFVDASTRYLGGGRAEEWFAFEAWLGRRLANAVALVCAYSSADLADPKTVERVVATHAYRYEPAAT